MILTFVVFFFLLLIIIADGVNRIAQALEAYVEIAAEIMKDED